MTVINCNNFYELSPRYDRARSFYNKAYIAEVGSKRYLISYETIVAAYDTKSGKIARYWEYWSLTTGRHINEFSRQMRGASLGKSEWDKLPINETPTIKVNIC